MLTEIVVVWDGRRGWSERYGDYGRGYIGTEVHPVLAAPAVHVSVPAPSPQRAAWMSTDAVFGAVTERWQSTAQIAEGCGYSLPLTAKRLLQLARDGWIERRLERQEPNGRRGTTIRALYRSVE